MMLREMGWKTAAGRNPEVFLIELAWDWKRLMSFCSSSIDGWLVNEPNMDLSPEGLDCAISMVILEKGLMPTFVVQGTRSSSI